MCDPFMTIATHDGRVIFVHASVLSQWVDSIWVTEMVSKLDHLQHILCHLSYEFAVTRIYPWESHVGSKLDEKSSQLDQANDESRQNQKEYEETRRQIEEDADREILDIKNKYERRLRDEKESNNRLKGETGILRKKVKPYSISRKCH